MHLDSSKRTFDFVSTGRPKPKPRETGVIEVRGPYYSAVTADYLKALLDDWGQYIDQ